MAAEPGFVQFSIGRVIGDSFGVFGRNFVSFSILALLLGLINLLIALFYFDPAQIEATGQFDATGLGISVLIGMLVNSLTQAAIIYGTFQDLRGQKAGIGDCISRGLASVIPVIVGSLLLWLGVSIAAIFFVIPGIILTLMWWVYVPAIVVEGKGIIESFGRSRALTKGRRWHILGLLILVLVLSLVVNFLVGLVVGVLFIGGSDVATPAAILQYVAMSLVTAFGAILVAVGYYYLRAEKEGVDVNEIAQVFD